MKTIYQRYCRGCHQVRDREFFPRHIDSNTICTDCQRGRDTAPASTTSAAPGQPVYVHRRGFNSKRGKDNRTTD